MLALSGGFLVLLILTKAIYLLALLFVVVFPLGLLPCLIFLNICDRKSIKRGKFDTKSYMLKRQSNMQKILVEDFGEECILKTKSGETYAVQIGLFGSVVIVDVLSSYGEIKLEAGSVKLKIQNQANKLPERPKTQF